jgi:hypothetical protein
VENYRLWNGVSSKVEDSLVTSKFDSATGPTLFFTLREIYVYSTL